MKYKEILLGLIILGGLLSVGVYTYVNTAQEEGREKPNIVLVTLEATRADHLPCYGYQRNTTPNICSLREDGIFFENVFSNSASTATSLPVVLTSKLPYRIPIYAHHQPLTEENVLFSDLESLGYSTEVYSDVLTDYMEWIDFNVSEFTDPFSINKKAIGNISKSEEPVFTWIHYDNNHFPYTPGEDFKGTYGSEEGVNQTIVEKIYGAHREIEGAHRKTKELKSEMDISREIEYIKNKYDDYLKESDYIVNDLIERLRKESLYEDTLLILTSDHGESLGEHGNYFEHRELYDPNLHVPLIVKLPGNEHKGEEVENQVSLVNVYRTLMDYLNYDEYKTRDVDGKSLLNFLDEDVPEQDVVSRWAQHFSLRTGDYKYILDTYTGKEEFYDLEVDPDETENLINETELPERAELFREKILEKEDKWSFTEEDFKESDDIPEELEERLKEMGYLE